MSSVEGGLNTLLFENPVPLKHIIEDNGNDKVSDDAADFVIDLHKGGKKPGAGCFKYNTVDYYKTEPQNLSPAGAFVRYLL